MKKIEKVLLVSDDSLERIAELNSVARKFSENVDALIFFSETKEDVAIGFGKVYGIKDIPSNSIDLVYSKAKDYDLILTSGFVGASIGGLLTHKLNACCVFGVGEIDYEEFVFSHSIYGDKAVVKYKPSCLPLVLVLKEKYFEQQLEPASKSQIEWLDVEKKQVEIVKEEKIEKEVELDKAKIVVGGGRGIGSEEGFDVLKKLADILGGTVGASRAAVDNGWISHQYQIGQSGVILSANLYFAFGISGATQHLAGIKNVKCVVAVNTDEEAPIFKRARFNVVADWKSFANVLINELEELNG